MISFIVPAHNEQTSLGRTLEAIHKAGDVLGIETPETFCGAVTMGGHLRPPDARLFRYLFRQTRWIERAKLAGLLALCLCCAWGATPVVIWFWTSLFHRFA